MKDNLSPYDRIRIRYGCDADQIKRIQNNQHDHNPEQGIKYVENLIAEAYLFSCLFFHNDNLTILSSE